MKKTPQSRFSHSPIRCEGLWLKNGELMAEGDADGLVDGDQWS